MVFFDQQYTPFMVFMLLCFAGLMVMFYFMLRSMEELARSMRDERNDITMTLRAIEKRISQLVTLQRTDLPAAMVAGWEKEARKEHAKAEGKADPEEGPAPAAKHEEVAEAGNTGGVVPAVAGGGLAVAAVEYAAPSHEEPADHDVTADDDDLPETFITEAPAESAHDFDAAETPYEIHVLPDAADETAQTADVTDSSEVAESARNADATAVSHELGTPDESGFIGTDEDPADAEEADASDDADAYAEALDLDVQASSEEPDGQPVAYEEQDDETLLRMLTEDHDDNGDVAVALLPEVFLPHTDTVESEPAEADVDGIHLSVDDSACDAEPLHGGAVLDGRETEAPAQDDCSVREDSTSMLETAGTEGTSADSFLAGNQKDDEEYVFSLFADEEDTFSHVDDSIADAQSVAGAMDEPYAEDDVILLTPDEIVYDADDVPPFSWDESPKNGHVGIGLDAHTAAGASLGRPSGMGVDDGVDSDSALAKALKAAGLDDEGATADGRRYLQDAGEPDNADTNFVLTADDAVGVPESGEGFVFSQDMPEDDFNFSVDEAQPSGDAEAALPGFFEEDTSMQPESLHENAGPAKAKRTTASSTSGETATDNITEFIVPE